MSDAVIVIPARLGSTRLPEKPLQDLGGLPLIVRVLERLAAVDIPRVVATDSPRIAAVVEHAGGEAVLTSPACASGTDRVAEVMHQRTERIVLNVQGDEPYVEPEGLRALVSLMRLEPPPPMATMACPLLALDAWVNPSVVKVVTDRAGQALYFSRAPIPFPRGQEGVPPGALRHIGVYAYRREALLELAGVAPSPLERVEGLEQLRALQLGWRIRVLTVGEHAPGIDTPEDLADARARWSRCHAPGSSGAEPVFL